MAVLDGDAFQGRRIMPAFIDITGQKFYKLTAVKRVPAKGKAQGAWFLFRCDCGEEREYQASWVTRNGGNIIKSCGCYKSERMQKEYGVATFNRLYQVFKEGAAKRSLAFDLPKELVRELIGSPCFYCGANPNQVYRRSKKYNQELLYNGLDRIDNGRGYVVGNVVACCWKCNRMKFSHSADEFKSIVSRIYNHWVKP